MGKRSELFRAEEIGLDVFDAVDSAYFQRMARSVAEALGGVDSSKRLAVYSFVERHVLSEIPGSWKSAKDVPLPILASGLEQWMAKTRTRSDGANVRLLPQAVLDVWVDASVTIRLLAESQLDHIDPLVAGKLSSMSEEELGGLLDRLAQDTSASHPDVAPDDMRTMLHVLNRKRFRSARSGADHKELEASASLETVPGLEPSPTERANTTSASTSEDSGKDALCSSRWAETVDLVDRLEDDAPEWEQTDQLKVYIDNRKTTAALRVRQARAQEARLANVAKWTDALQKLREAYSDSLDLYGISVPEVDFNCVTASPAAVDATIGQLVSQVSLLASDGANGPTRLERRAAKETITSRLIPNLQNLVSAGAVGLPSTSSDEPGLQQRVNARLESTQTRKTGKPHAPPSIPGDEEHAPAAPADAVQANTVVGESLQNSGSGSSAEPTADGHQETEPRTKSGGVEDRTEPLGVTDKTAACPVPDEPSQEPMPITGAPPSVKRVSPIDTSASEGQRSAAAAAQEDADRSGDPTLLYERAKAGELMDAATEADRMGWSLLLANEHVGLAHALAWAARRLGVETNTLPLDPRLVEGLVLASHYTSPTDPIAETLDHDVIEPLSDKSFGTILTMDAAGYGPVGRLLLTACCLHPALLSSSTAIQVLQALAPGDGRLHDYIELVVEFGREFTGVSPEARQGFRDSGALGSALTEMGVNAARWLSDARARKMKYARATQVWQMMVSTGGEVYKLVRPVQDNDETQLDSVAHLMDRLSQAYAVDELIDKLSDRLAHAKRVRIEATPRERLHSQVGQAVEIARKWVNLHRSLNEDFHGRHAAKYSSLKSRIARAETALLASLTQELADETLSRECRAAKSQLHNAVLKCRADYEFRQPQVSETEEPGRILNWELLKVHGITLGSEPGEWSPQETPLDVLRTIASYLIAASPPSWSETVDRCIREEDYASCDLILGLPASMFASDANQLDDAERSSLHKRRDAEMRLSTERLLRSCDKASARIEGEYGRLLLTDEQRSEFIDRIDQLRQRARLGDVGRFAEARLVLDASSQDEERVVQENFLRLKSEVLSSPELSQNPGLRIRVEEALRDRQVPAAFELVYQGEQAGSQLTSSTSRFVELFGSGLDNADPGLLEKLQDIASKNGRAWDLVKRVIAVRHTEVPGSQEESAVQLMNLWVTCKRQQAAPFDVLRKMLTGLGFQNIDIVAAWPGVKQSSDARVQMYKFTLSSPLEDRSLCPLPKYGSEAKNGYRLVCIWGHMTEGEMASVLAARSTEPTIVFYFFRMTLKSRRDYARLVLEDPSRAALVLDETLLLFLCGERGSRLPGFFECALPFVSTQPYVLRAGEVPPEMFYGRRREVESLLDMSKGSCLVYGGRQVGKTALLRTAERQFPQGNVHRKAIWVDLKAKHGITEWLMPMQLMEELTVLLAEALRSHGVLEAKIRIPTSWTGVLKAIQHWIEDNSERQLLLLLDEADGLLQVDERQHYLAVAALKSLMDETQGRFKVVFAGLHNVQRMTHSGNQPLAHLGEAICVGALMDSGWTTGGSETREAIDLVRRPLAALGYYFQSESLIWLILSRTCYYTSWIQQYCKALLADLNMRRRFQSVDTKTPPYYITAEDVDRVYESETVKQGLHELFRLTLELDPRYQVLVYLLGADMVVQEHRDFGQAGYPVSWLRDQAVKYWRSGFIADTSEGTVRVLLDELVGLGVLRRFGDGRYKLRSPSTLMLLGKDYDEMVEGLTNPIVESSIGVPPEEFRVTLDGTEDHLSPLTLEQTRRVLTRESGVSVIAGCALSGIGDSLSGLSRPPFSTSELVSSVDVAAFGHDLETALESARDSSSTAIIVGPQTPWSLGWIARAEDIVGSKRQRNLTVRVVFVADAAKTMSVLTERDLGLEIVSLRPWGRPGVRWWLETQNAPTNRLDEILTLTGGWSSLLYHLNQKRGRQAGMSFDTALEELRSLLGRPAELHDHILNDLSPTVEAHREIFQAMAWLKPFDADEIEANCKGVARETIDQCVRWTAILSLARESGSAGLWELDDVFREAVVNLLS